MRAPRKKGQGILLDETRDNASARGKAAARKQYAGNVVWVEGELVSTSAIGERLGVNRTTAGERLKAAQKLDGPVTWAKLEGKG